MISLCSRLSLTEYDYFQPLLLWSSCLGAAVNNSASASSRLLDSLTHEAGSIPTCLAAPTRHILSHYYDMGWVTEMIIRRSYEMRIVERKSEACD